MDDKPIKFASEVALCAAFIEAIDKRVWTPYAETEGWDILLHRKKDGFQIGIEAKLAMNVEVINQAIEEYGTWSAAAPGPDCRAVLVPEGSNGKFGRICDYLGVVILVMKHPDRKRFNSFGRDDYHPQLPTESWHDTATWHEWAPAKRHKLPEYVPDVAAGSSAPIQLTDWKIRALKVAIVIEINGFVTRDDFKHLQIDHRRWIANEWLKLSDKKPGYVPGKFMPSLKAQHPVVYGKIKSDAKVWMPKPGAALI